MIKTKMKLSAETIIREIVGDDITCFVLDETGDGFNGEYTSSQDTSFSFELIDHGSSWNLTFIPTHYIFDQNVWCFINPLDDSDFVDTYKGNEEGAMDYANRYLIQVFDVDPETFEWRQI